MTFAEHAVAQVLREVAQELWIETTQYFSEGPLARCTVQDQILLLRRIADKLSPQHPGEK